MSTAAEIIFTLWFRAIGVGIFIYLWEDGWRTMDSYAGWMAFLNGIGVGLVVLIGIGCLTIEIRFREQPA